MSQYDFGTITPSTKSGTALATDLMSWRDALNSSHKGPTAPTYKITGMRWIDDTTTNKWIGKFYDGAAWLTEFYYDAANDVAWAPYVPEMQRYPLAGGTADALTLTPLFALTAYADTEVVKFEAASNNTTAATLNISGVGAKAIRKISAGVDIALVAGDLLDGVRYTVNYDTAANAAAGAWVLVSSLLPAGSTIVTPTITNATITGATGFFMGRMIYALTLSNNGTDAVNDIDIAAGSATDASAFVLMSLGSALTKRLDAAWAVGTNQGGRMSAAAITDTTYHVWLIRRSDTGVVDVGFDVSATAPTMPANYDQKRRIGSIIRAAGTIIAFSQVGNHFLLSVPVRDITISATLGTTAVLSALTVPIGIKVEADIMGSVSNASTYDILLTSPDQANTLPTATIFTFRGAGAETIKFAGLRIRTDTSGQIRSRSDIASSSFIANTNGWIDTRGAE